MEKKYTKTYKVKEHQPFRLGVALSGGGARGFAEAGALQAIDEAGLTIDVISGVSAGSVVAVLYAAGLKPEAILEMFVHGRVYDFTNITVGKGALMTIDKFIAYLTRCLGKIKRLEQLHIPTYIVATNFDTGQPKIFDKGEIGPIVQASCSIPIVIPPVNIDGVEYVDGGVVRNLPAWAIRGKCDQLIGINVSPVLPKRSERSLLSIALRSYTLLAKSNQAQDMAMCNLVVSMDTISKHKTFSLKEIEDVYRTGYEKTKEALEAYGINA